MSSGARLVCQGQSGVFMRAKRGDEASHRLNAAASSEHLSLAKFQVAMFAPPRSGSTQRFLFPLLAARTGLKPTAQPAASDGATPAVRTDQTVRTASAAQESRAEAVCIPRRNGRHGNDLGLRVRLWARDGPLLREGRATGQKLGVVSHGALDGSCLAPPFSSVLPTAPQQVPRDDGKCSL